MIIDDSRRDDLVSSLGTSWRGVSDRVMGGESDLVLRRDRVRGRRCLHLTGQVRLENNGGFIQAALDLDPAGGLVDLSGFRYLRLLVSGNDTRYAVHLRTGDVQRPWQSYRAGFQVRDEWHEVDLALDAFEPHRIQTPLDLTRARRIGVVAIGRAFQVDLAVATLELCP